MDARITQLDDAMCAAKDVRSYLASKALDRVDSIDTLREMAKEMDVWLCNALKDVTADVNGDDRGDNDLAYDSWAEKQQ